MRSPGPITIVGGGLAGLTLGIGLRQRGIPVTLWEAGTYPRHRVCGEFISGNGLPVLQRLGLNSLLEKYGAVPVNSATFISGSNRSPVRDLPARAVGLSRYLLDAALAEAFQQLGGDLRQGARWNSPSGTGVSPVSSCSHGRDARATAKVETEAIIRATGRRAQPTENGWRWFGLKVHATNVPLAADLEMHVSENHYVGVNRINGGEMNVCGLFRGRPGESQKSGLEMLRGEPGSSLHERLSTARFDENSFCSVAGLSLKPQRAADKTECCIGDAVTMIPPVTGNGMSMAFESAEIALEPLARFSRGEVSWEEARAEIACGCDTAFAGRLVWAHRLQRLMFSPVLRTPLGALLLRSDGLWNFLFAKTR